LSYQYISFDKPCNLRHGNLIYYILKCLEITKLMLQASRLDQLCALCFENIHCWSWPSGYRCI